MPYLNILDKEEEEEDNTDIIIGFNNIMSEKITPFNVNVDINPEDLRRIVPGADRESARAAYFKALEHRGLTTSIREGAYNYPNLEAIRELFCPDGYKFLEDEAEAVVEKNPKNEGNYKADLEYTLNLMQKAHPKMKIHINDQIFIDHRSHELWDTRAFVQEKWRKPNGHNKRPSWHRPIMVYGREKRNITHRLMSTRGGVERFAKRIFTENYNKPLESPPENIFYLPIRRTGETATSSDDLNRDVEQFAEQPLIKILEKLQKLIKEGEAEPQMQSLFYGLISLSYEKTQPYKKLAMNKITHTDNEPKDEYDVLYLSFNSRLGTRNINLLVNLLNEEYKDFFKTDD